MHSDTQCYVFEIFPAGKVYNLTHYMKFHPGGKEDLMKGAGIDCTILFNEVIILLFPNL